jgi:hypothetical protein
VIHKPEPWSATDATKIITGLARDVFDLQLTQHARERMADRDIVIADLLHVLKTGSVHKPGEAREPYSTYCYTIEGSVPTQNSLKLRIVVRPNVNVERKFIKVVTTMWIGSP